MTPARKRMRLEDGCTSFTDPLEPSATMHDLPSEVMKNIFSFVGKGNYCFVGPVSKDFCYNYLTMDVIEDKFAHKMDYLQAIGRNKITTAEAVSSSFELADYCFFNAPEKFQKTTVHKSIRKGRKDIVELGHAMGIDVKKLSLKEYMPLGRIYQHVLRDVVKNGNLEMLKFLIEKGANLESEMGTIVETAAQFDQLLILKWLHRNKFNPFSASYRSPSDFRLGNRGLVIAAKFGNLAIVEWGIDIVKIDFTQDFIMNNAAKSGNFELVKYLKSKEMPWNEHTFCNAAASGNIALLQYLLENGCPYDDPGICTDAIKMNSHDKVVVLLQWLHEHGIPWDESCCEAAAKTGNLKALKYLKSNSCPWSRDSLKVALQNHHFEVVEYCLAQKCPMGNNDICRFAMSCNDHDLDCKLLKLLREYSAPWSEETTSAAIYNANFQALKWCVSNGCPLDTSVNIENVIGQGNIEIMKWMRTQGFFFDKDTCASAAYGNNLEVLRWLRSEGYSLDDHTFFNAVSSGDLDMIQFCIDNDIPFDEELYVGAISNNDDPINTIKLLRSNGYPWHPSACARAVVECDLKLLLWLRYNGCPWDENVCNEAVEGDNLEILKYAHENGCPWSKETYARCFSEEGLSGEYEQIPTDHQCSDEIIGYLQKHNCPRPDPSDWRIIR